MLSPPPHFVKWNVAPEKDKYQEQAFEELKLYKIKIIKILSYYRVDFTFVSLDNQARNAYM